MVVACHCGGGGLIIILALLRAFWGIETGANVTTPLDWLESTVSIALSALAVVGALAVEFGRNAIGAAIEIVIDVLADISNYSRNTSDDLDLAKSQSSQLSIRGGSPKPAKY